MPAPYSPTIGAPFPKGIDLQGSQMARVTLWNVTLASPLLTVDGAVGYRTNAGNKGIVFYDSAIAAEERVPRISYNETLTGTWAFNGYFTVPGTTKITNLNADLLDGYNTSTTAVQSTIPIYSTGGTLFVATPTDPLHAVTKGYADALGQGINPAVDGPVVVATTAEITNLSNASVTIDGVTLVAGQRVLVKDKASPDGVVATHHKYDGIYVVGTVSGGTAPFTRATDSDTTAELDRQYVFVSSGTTNVSRSYFQTTNDPVVGTDALNYTIFYQAAAHVGGNGISIVGETISVKISGSTTYTANRILFTGSTSTIDSDANLTWDGSLLTANGRCFITANANDDGARVINTNASAYGLYIQCNNVASNRYALNVTSNSGSNVLLYVLNSGPVIVGSSTALASGVLQVYGGLTFNGAQTIQTSTGNLTLTTAAGNGNVQVNAHGTGDFIVFTNQLYVDQSSGYVGIGNTAPVALLNIGVNQTTTDAAQLILNDDANFRGEFGYNESGNTVMHIANTYNNNAARLDIRMKGSAAANAVVTVLGSGNIGIGTTEPASNLEIRGANRVLGTDEHGIEVIRSSDSYAMNKGGSLSFGGKYNAAGGYATFASIWGLKDSAADGAFTGYLAFATSPGGTPTEKMRITSSGNVGIGTSSPVAKTHSKGSGTSGQVSADWILENSSSGTLGLDITGSAGSSRARWLRAGGPSTGTNSMTESFCVMLEGSNAGNVGIGTTEPGQLLDVNGVSRMRDYLQLQTGTTLSGYFGRASGFIAGGGHNELGIRSESKYYVATNGDGTPRVTVDTSGKVGIGTTSPQNGIHVVVDDATTNNVTNVLRLDHTTTGTAANGIGVGLAFIAEKSNGGAESVADIQAILTDVTAGNEDGALAFRTNLNGTLTEYVRITSTGNVGIGTTSPNIYGAGNGRFLSILGAGSVASAASGRIELANNNTGSDYGVGELLFVLANNNNEKRVAQIYSVTEGNGGANGFGGSLYFVTKQDGVAGGGAVRIYIANSGHVGIGTIGPQRTLDVAGSGIRVQGITSGGGTGSGMEIGNTAIYSYNRDTSQYNLMNIGDSMYIASGASSNRNVGIGTTSPGSKLHVSGDISTDNTYGFRSYGVGSASAANAEWIQVDHNGASDKARFFTTASGTGSARDIVFSSGTGFTQLYLKNGGNVGIGTTSPGRPLSVKADSNGYNLGLNDSGNTERSWFYSTSGGSFWQTASGVKLQLYGSSGTGLVIDNASNVGIGTTTPLTNLHVRTGGSSIAAQAVSTAAFQNNANASDNCILSIASGNTGLATIFLGDPDNYARGRFQYDNNTDAIEFYTATTKWMSISSTGVVNLAQLTASALVVTDSSKNLISGPALPAGSAAARVVKTVLTSGMISGNVATQTHNLSTDQVNAQVQKVSTKQRWYPDIVMSTNSIAIDFGFAPGDGEFEVITVG